MQVCFTTMYVAIHRHPLATMTIWFAHSIETQCREVTDQEFKFRRSFR